MLLRETKSTLEAATAQLREIALASDDGALLGSEDKLLAELGVSRSTLKQAARLLEREGLVRVKRGVNGGYYGERPNERTIESVMSAYLQTLDMDIADVAVVTSILWFEVVRRAACLRTSAAHEVAERFRAKVLAIRAEATFAEVSAVEQDSRAAIFDLVGCRYIELIFHINAAFGGRHFRNIAVQDGTPEHRAFVEAWQKAKALELGAVADGDTELAAVAARNVRKVWNRRIYGPDFPLQHPHDIGGL